PQGQTGRPAAVAAPLNPGTATRSVLSSARPTIRRACMRHVITTALALALAFPPVLQAQEQAPAMPAPATSGAEAVPATASSSAIPDRPDLDDIRNFTRVYEIIRQAYVKKVDNKTLMDAAITGMLSKLDPHSAWLDQE